MRPTFAPVPQRAAPAGAIGGTGPGSANRRVHRSTGRIGAVVTGAAAVAIGAAVAVPGAGAATTTSAARAIRSAYGSMRHQTSDVTFTESRSTAGSHGSRASETVTGSGEADFATHSFELTVNSPSGGTEQLIETGGVLYLKVPPADASKVPGGKPWVSLDLAQIAATKGSTAESAARLVSDSPDQAVSSLAAVTKRVSKVGTTKIDGSKVTEYRTSVSLKKLATTSGATSAAIKQEEAALHTTTVPLKVWTSKKYVRRLAIEVPIASTATSGGASSSSTTSSTVSGSTGANASSAGSKTVGHATVTITFTKIGAPVHITAPPSTQVASLNTTASPPTSGSAA
jgi:hypothetical protein